jgi:hypothetical protein
MINIGSQEPYYVSIMGQAGMEYGMIVLKTGKLWNPSDNLPTMIPQKRP